MMANPYPPVPVRMRIGDGPQRVVGEIWLDSYDNVITVTNTMRVRSQLAEALREIAAELESPRGECPA
jgi:hypothetical protein